MPKNFSYCVGRDDPARLVVAITPPHPSSPTAMPPSPLGGEGFAGGHTGPPLQYTQHPFILCRRARRPGAPSSQERPLIRHRLRRCHLPPWVGKALRAAFYRLPPLGGKALRAATRGRPYNTHNIRSSYAVGRDDSARRRRKNAPSSVIAFGDATFPPGWGRLVGRRFIGFPPQGGRLGGRPHGVAPTIHTTSVHPFRRGRCPQRPGGHGGEAPGNPNATQRSGCIWERTNSGMSELSPSRRKRERR